MEWMATSLAVLGAYLLGSISFAVVISRVMGLADPRSYGSRNPGATNVLRSGSKLAAVITLLGDALKGTLAVGLAQYVGAKYGVGEFGVALTGLAAFVGHLYPVFFRFQGGKGVATFFGVIGILNPWLGLICAVAWFVMVIFFRFASLASITAAIVAVLAQGLIWGATGMLICIAAMTLLLVLRHRQNISNLLQGKERKIGQRA